VYAIVCPWIVVFKPFIHDERHVELIRFPDRKYQRVIILDALVHLHPVENVPGVQAWLSII
jgi:hypothetical protein